MQIQKRRDFGVPRFRENDRISKPSAFVEKPEAENIGIGVELARNDGRYQHLWSRMDSIE
jgi:hypothetical protein